LDFDVVIIGASTAGLYTAELLAKRGRHVGLFEEMPGVSTGARTYIITQGLFRVLPDLDRQLIRQRIDHFQLYAGDFQADVKLAEPDMVLDRRQLRESLVQRARASGAILCFNSKFTGLRDTHNGSAVRVEIDGKEQLIHANILIGADGINSRVRAAVGLSQVRSVPLLQAEIKLPDFWQDEVCGVWFDVKHTKYFYWLIPDRDRRGVVGLIGDQGSDLRSSLEEFLTHQGYQALDHQSGQAAYHIPGAAHEIHTGSLRVLLVGDAAGQVKVTTVGGCVTGFAGARAAAEAVTKGIAYRQAAKELNRELNTHYYIRQLLHRMTSAEYEQLVSYLDKDVCSFLGTRDRDQMRREFWKLIFLQPRFIPLGLKLLLRLSGR
jgi:digeranylgeranylglycerophospholipid reductase